MAKERLETLAGPEGTKAIALRGRREQTREVTFILICGVVVVAGGGLKGARWG